jgi:RNA polymerase sigma-70 factor, ECF subfamily
MRFAGARPIDLAAASGLFAAPSIEERRGNLKGSPPEPKVPARPIERGPAGGRTPSQLPTPPAGDDTALMAKVAAGDATARARLVRRLLRRVQRLCGALLRSGNDAQDAAQVSILEIFRSAGSYRGDSSLERWCDRITVRTAIRMSRAEKRAQRVPVEAYPSASSSPASEETVLAQEYLSRISERQRMVLVLRHAFEYSIEEIAELAGISPNTVKDRLLRGRGIMRKMLRREQLLVELPGRDADEY